MDYHQFLYRVNPFCPDCDKAYCTYDIFLSEAEQGQLDQYYLEQIRCNADEAQNSIDQIVIPKRRASVPVTDTAPSKF